MVYVVTITWSNGKSERHEVTRAQALALADWQVRTYPGTTVTITTR